MSKFNFNIDIDNSEQNSLLKTNKNTITQLQSYNEHAYVDLGLPSKTIWCKYNLGVNPKQLEKAKDWYGDYYAFGELNTKDMYSLDNYKWYDKDKGRFEMLKYNYSEELELEDDIAYQINNKCKIPDREQFYELIKNTSHTFVQNYNNVWNLNGVIFKNNNEELFLPAAGHYCNKQLCAKEHYGVYWTQNSGNPGNAWELFFSGSPDTYNSNEKHFKENRIEIGLGDRCQGYTIRPVLI